MFEEIGIYGWEEAEVTVLSAIMADLPILFIGRHGANKTDGARQIAKAIWGPKVKFTSFHCPLLTTEDLLGWPDPSSLKKGKMGFIDTGNSVWNCEVALWDEINRANQMVGSKILEIVRTKRVMDRPTALRFSFSAINPPKEYESAYMSQALASRFVCIRVPDADTMSDVGSVLKKLRKRKKVRRRSSRLRNLITRALEYEVDEKNQKAIDDLLIVLHESSTHYISIRSLEMIRRLVVANLQLSSIGIPLTTVNVVNSVLGAIPEFFEITRSKKEADIVFSVQAAVNSYLTRVDLPENMISPPPSDPAEWGYSIVKEAENHPERCLRLYKEVKNKEEDGSIDPEVSKAVRGGIWLAAARRDTAFMESPFSLESLDTTRNVFVIEP